MDTDNGALKALGGTRGRGRGEPMGGKGTSVTFSTIKTIFLNGGDGGGAGWW